MGQCGFKPFAKKNSGSKNFEREFLLSTPEYSSLTRNDSSEKNKKQDIRILLLGTGNSGKSTIFKQFKLRYKDGFGSAEMDFYRDYIPECIITTMRNLLKNAQDLLFECGIVSNDLENNHQIDEGKGILVMLRNAGSTSTLLAETEANLDDHTSQERKLSGQSSSNYQKILPEETTTKEHDEANNANRTQSPAKLSPDIYCYAEALASLASGTKLTARIPFETAMPKITELSDSSNALMEDTEYVTVVDMLKAIWRHPQVQRVYAMESKIPSLEAPLEYYMENIDRICDPKYTPTAHDILRSRKRTQGTQLLRFSLDSKHTFLLIDPGGQRMERKKWISWFDCVEVVLFVVGLDGYNQLCIEDGKTNRIRESLALFDEICSSPFFKKTNFVLFLNKMDIFQKKIQHTPLKTYFEDYQGSPTDAKQGVEYLQQKFKDTFSRAKEDQRGTKSSEAMVYSIPATATSQEDMDRILKVTTRHICLRLAMGQTGMT